MTVLAGRLAKVTIGTYQIAEGVRWSWAGQATEMLDATQFGDAFREFEFGLGDFGTVTLSGHYDMSDTNGQVLLYSAWKNKSALTAIKFYINNTSYYVPDVTGNSASRCLPVSVNTVEFDQAGLGTIEFALKVSGQLLLV